MKEQLTAGFLNPYFDVRPIETGSHVTIEFDGDVRFMKVGRDKTEVLGCQSYEIIK